MTILIVTGPLRSGTSMVARIAHQIGINMGFSMVAPLVGTTLDPEYEEAEMVQHLIDSGDSWIPNYAEKRINEGHRNWGMKSPWLAPLLKQLVANYQELDRIVVVRCTRDSDSLRDAVIRAAIQADMEDEIDMLMEVNVKIEEACKDFGPFDLTLDFKDIKANPYMNVALPLAELMGTSTPDVLTSIHGIRRTEEKT